MWIFSIDVKEDETFKDFFTSNKRKNGELEETKRCTFTVVNTFFDLKKKELHQVWKEKKN